MSDIFRVATDAQAKPSSLVGVSRVPIEEPKPIVNKDEQFIAPSLAAPYGETEGQHYAEIDNAIRRYAYENNDLDLIPRWEAAKEYAKIYRVDESFALQNLDSLREDYWGKANLPSNKTDLKAIADAFGIGATGIGKSLLYSAISTNPNGEPTERQAEKLARYEKELAELGDRTPRSWGVEAAKLVSQAVPFVALTTGITAAASAVAPASGGSSTAFGAQVIRFALTQGLPFAVNQRVMQGSLYEDMRKRGLDHQNANILSNVFGSIDAAIEMVSGPEAAVRKMFNPAAMKKISENVTKKMFVEGSIGAGVAFLGKEYTIGSFGQTVEELGQQVSDTIALNIANEMIREKGGIVSKEDEITIQSFARDMGRTAVDSLIVSAVLQVPTTLAMGARLKGDLKEMKANAPTMRNEAFVKTYEDHPAFEGLSSEQRRNLLEEVRTRELAKKFEEKLDKAEPESEYEPVRKEDGSLHSDETVIDETKEGNQKTQFVVRSPKGDASYGWADLTVDGDTVTIDYGSMEKGYENLSGEMIQMIAQAYPGHKLVVGESNDISVIGAFNKATSENPVSEYMGATWADIDLRGENLAAANRDRARYERAGFDFGERETLVAMHTIAAKIARTEYSKLETPMIERGEIGIKGKAGSFSLDEFGKGIIRIAEKGNSATLIHEYAHFTRHIVKDSADMKVFEEVYGVKNGKWGVKQEERFADDLMRYLQDGKVSDEKAKPLVKRIAEALKQFWKKGLSKLNLDPRVQAKFEEWFAGDAHEEVAEKELEAPAVAAKIDIKNESVASSSPYDVYVAGRTPEYVKLADLEVTRNIKRGANPKTGEVTPLVGKYDTVAPNPIAVYKRLSGKNEIITGRHRAALANRSGESEILAYIFKEEDGFSERDARLMDARQNIKDNAGSVQDWLTFFLQDKMSLEEAESLGLLSGLKGRQAYVIASSGSPELVALVLDEKISNEKAAAIAKIAGGDKDLIALGIASKEMSLDELSQELFMSKVAGKEGDGGQTVFEGMEASDAYLEDRRKMKAAAVTHIGKVKSNLRTWKNMRDLKREDRIAALKEAFPELGEAQLNEALVESKIAELQSRMDRLQEGRWMYDPQIVAQIRKEAGLSYDENVIMLAEQVLEDPQQGMMFQDESDLTGETFQHKYHSDSMRQYKTFEDWLATQHYDENLYSNNDEYIKTMKEFYEYATANKPKQFVRRGDFTKFLFNGETFEDFLAKAGEEMYSKKQYKSQAGIDRARALRDLIGNTPQLKRAIDTYRAKNQISDKAFAAAKNAVKKDETMAKVFYARLMNDSDLMFEAMDEITEVQPIEQVALFRKPGRSMAMIREIIESIKDEDFKAAIKEGRVTPKAVRRYISRERMKNNQLLQSVKGEAKMNIKLVRELGAKELLQYKASIDEIRAAQEIKTRLDELRSFIMSPHGGLTPSVAAQVKFIQDYLENGGKPSDDFRSLSSMAFIKNPELLQNLIRFLDGLNGRNYENMSIEELNDLADYMDILVKEGRGDMALLKRARGLAAKQLRAEALEALKNSGRYVDPVLIDDESAQEIQDKHKINEAVSYNIMRPDIFFRRFLDGKSGSTANLDALFKRTIYYNDLKQEHIYRRTQPILDYIKEKKLNKILNNSATISGVKKGGADLSTSMSNLLGIYLLVGTDESYNAAQREAFIYGNLFTAEEKNANNDEVDGSSGREYMEALYKAKLKAVMESYKQLSPELLHLGDIMLDTFADMKDWVRFSDAVAGITYKEPKLEKHYFALRRKGLFVDSDGDSIESRLAGFDPSTKGFIEKGMAIERKRNIAPQNQVEIETDAMKLFLDGVEHQEHLINVGPHARDLIMIYKSKGHSDAMRRSLESTIGKGGLKKLDDYIDMVANPYAKADLGDGSDLVRFGRGAMVIGNLAYRYTSVVTQLLTSPLPTIIETPGGLVRSSLECIASGNPIAWYKKIEAMSPTLRYRQLDEVKVALENMGEKGASGVIKKFGQVGMKGLVLADRISVAISWKAVYDKYYQKSISEYCAKMDKAPEELTKAQLDSISENAKTIANEFIIKTQPSAEDLYRSPLFRHHGGAWDIILQFGQPLNVVYQNVAYDMPDAFREKEFGKGIGYIVAYTLSGLAVASVQLLRGRGPDDEADAEEWKRFWLHASTQQFTDSLPLVGDQVSDLTRLLITGHTGYRGDSTLPMVDMASQGFEAIYRGLNSEGEDQRDQFIRAAEKLGAATASSFGLPYRAGMDVYGGIKSLANKE